VPPPKRQLRRRVTVGQRLLDVGHPRAVLNHSPRARCHLITCWS
jgi:hypothetical protein